MCGIAGIHGLTGIADAAATMRRMTAAMAHRGPDADGVWNDDRMLLGHRRLSIIDLSHGSDQPFHSSDGRFVIVYNGEIYNYKNLRGRLAGRVFRTASDTEVLLEAYREWGAACLEQLEGMFAFAIWDREKRELFVARDRLGIKPLYIHRTEGRFMFASELRTLLASELVPRRLDREALADHLRYQTVHAPRTMVAEVRMLMPGHWLRVNDQGMEEQRWWDPVSRVDRSSEGMSPEQVHREVRRRLTEAVSKRMISDVPFGAFLSGGIDSSAVVGLMAEASTSPVHTFSVVFDQEEFSEERYARMAAERFRTEHTTLRLRGQDMLEALPDVLTAMDHPSGDGVNIYMVSRATKQAGITMALSGLGSDELFTGYPVFLKALALHDQRWITRIPLLPRRALASLLARARPSLARTTALDALKLETTGLEVHYPTFRRTASDRWLARLVADQRMGPNLLEEQMTHLLVSDGGNKLPFISQVSLGEISSYLQNILLRDTDQMSMAHALEVRVPFMDHALVEFVLGVGDHLKRPSTPKPLLVNALSGLLPDALVNRPKMGFVLPWDHWLRHELRGFCNDRFHMLADHGAFNADAVLGMWRGFLAGEKHVGWDRVWTMAALGDWLERHRMRY